MQEVVMKNSRFTVCGTTSEASLNQPHWALTMCDGIWNMSATGNVCSNVMTEHTILMGLPSNSAKYALMLNKW